MNLSKAHNTIRNKYAIIFSILTSLFLLSCFSPKGFVDSPLYKQVGPYIYYYEGLQNRLYGNFNEAIQNQYQSLKLDTLNSAVYYELALSYSVLNDKQKSLKYIRKAEEIEPDNSHYLHFLALALLQNLKVQEAYEIQKKLVEIDPNNENFKFQLALIKADLGNFDQALDLIIELEKTFGTVPRLSDTKVKIFLQNNDIDNAKKEVDKILEIEENNLAFLIHKSEILFREGKDEQGIDVLLHAKNLNSNFPQPLIELYQRYLEIGNFKQVIKLLSQVLDNDLFSTNEKIMFFQPLLYEQPVYQLYGQELDSAIDALITMFPESIAANEISYEHFIRRRNFPQARKMLESLLVLDNDNPKRLERLISFDYSFDRKEKVIYNSLLGIKQFPQEHIFYIFNAISLEEIGDLESAITVLERGINNVQKSTEKSELYGTLGDFFYKQNIKRKAYRSYRNSLRYNPKNARILNNYSYYLALDERKLNKALEMSTKAVSLDPNNSTFIDTKGWVLFTMKRYEEAREILRNAIAKGGNSSAVINEHYGDVLYKTGNKENAYIYWMKAKELGGSSDKLEEKLKKKTYVP